MPLSKVNFKMNVRIQTNNFRRISLKSVPVFLPFSPDSLSNVEPHWAKEVKHFCRGVPVILVGNKIDLRNDQDTIQNLTTLQKVR